MLESGIYVRSIRRVQIYTDLHSKQAHDDQSEKSVIDFEFIRMLLWGLIFSSAASTLVLFLEIIFALLNNLNKIN